MTDEDRARNYYPCGCLINDLGAHRGDCPDYDTVPSGAARTSNRLDDLQWVRKADRRADNPEEA